MTDIETEYEFPMDPVWSIDRARLDFTTTLGEGEFGKVRRVIDKS